MATIGATSASSRPGSVSNPDIQNIVTVASTEVTVTFPANTSRYRIQMRDTSGFQVKTSSLAVEYYTVECGNDYREEGLAAFETHTIYIVPDKAGVLEVLSWS